MQNINVSKYLKTKKKNSKKCVENNKKTCRVLNIKVIAKILFLDE